MGLSPIRKIIASHSVFSQKNVNFTSVIKSVWAHGGEG